MFRINLLKTLCVMALAAFFCGCGGPNTERMVDVNPVLWGNDDHIFINIDDHDTVSLYKLDLLFMFNDNFEQRPVDFDITVIAPDQTRLTERVTVSTFAQTQKQNDLYELSYPYRDSVRLSQPGGYYFSIVPVDGICGMNAAGLNFSKI